MISDLDLSFLLEAGGKTTELLAQAVKRIEELESRVENVEKVLKSHDLLSMLKSKYFDHYF